MPDTRISHLNARIASRVQGYAGAVAMVAASTLVGLWIAPRWGTAPVDMIYLPAVLAAAALWGLGPAVVAGVIAALAYNFFFIVPVHTCRPSHRRSDGPRAAHRGIGHQPARRRNSCAGSPCRGPCFA